MVESKLYQYPEGNYPKLSTDKSNGNNFTNKRYRGKKIWTKTQGPELESDTNFKGWCSDLEGYVFNIGPRASTKFSRTMKGMERYLGAT